MARPAGVAPARSVLETVQFTGTTDVKIWWSGTVTLRRLRIASAACCYYHYGPKGGHDGGNCTREPQLCRLVPWLLGYVVIGNRTAAQVTRRQKTSLMSVLSDRGLRLVEPAGFAPAPSGLKVRCATVEHHSSKWGARREWLGLLALGAARPAFGGPVALLHSRTRDCGLADRRVAVTPRAH